MTKPPETTPLARVDAPADKNPREIPTHTALEGLAAQTSMTPRSPRRTSTYGWPGPGVQIRARPFVKLARTIRRHRAGILADPLGLSNGRLEMP